MSLGILLLLLLILLLLAELPLLVALPADRRWNLWLLAGLQPVGILRDALALRLSMGIQDAAVACLVRPHNGRLRGFQLRVGGVGFEAHLIGESAQGIMEWIEFLNRVRGTPR